MVALAQCISTEGFEQRSKRWFEHKLLRILDTPVEM